MQKERLVELYGLHAELPGRVSQRREGGKSTICNASEWTLVAVVAMVIKGISIFVK